MLRIHWRRLDVPGREAASLERTPDGWRLAGELQVTQEGVHAQLAYDIRCDRAWRTRSARVTGTAGGRPVRIDLASDGQGHWTRDGVPVPEVEGAEDVDLGFTPATNTLPIRRLALAVGESRAVRSAWLRFPQLRLQLLEQTYAREAERTYRYRALVDGEPFEAALQADAHGRVLRYENLWEQETATMRKTLEFRTTIAAPRDRVWRLMLAPDSYADWTAAFCEGSRYEGSWEQGSRIRFLTPTGEGMYAEVVENRRDEFVSIRHLGEIRGGVELAPGDPQASWSGAYENYHFADVPGGTEVRVTVDVTPEYEAMMNDAFPRALQRLKALCERAPG